ncbi:MAG: hypothetical protein ABSC23_04600 [Bryobacteraceae bacterium]|jgi:hypothetical protein
MPNTASEFVSEKSFPKIMFISPIRGRLQRSLPAEWTGTGCGAATGRLRLPNSTIFDYNIYESSDPEGRKVDINIWEVMGGRNTPEPFCVNQGAAVWRFEYEGFGSARLAAHATLRVRCSCDCRTLNISRFDIVSVLESAVERLAGMRSRPSAGHVS